MPIKLSFRDNSSNESGFHVFRSSAPMSPDRLPQPFMTVGPNTDAIVDDQFGGIFERRWYYRVASFVDGGNRSVSDEIYAGYDGSSPTLQLDFVNQTYAVASGLGLDL